MSDPAVGMLADIIAYIQPELFQVRNVVAAQEDVDEVLETMDISDGVVISSGTELPLVDVEARHGAPQVPPPRGEHARLHGLPGLEARKDGMEEIVRQGAQPVLNLAKHFWC
jgi:hypothetical protein